MIANCGIVSAVSASVGMVERYERHRNWNGKLWYVEGGLVDLRSGIGLGPGERRRSQRGRKVCVGFGGGTAEGWL